jgi:hypothetical protein
MEPTMAIRQAREIDVRGATVNTKNPWALWIITFMTLGIWGIVWWYRMNRELRDVSTAYGENFAMPPAVSTVMMALWPVALLPALATCVISSIRARSVQKLIDVDDRKVNPVIATLLFFVIFSHVWYIQRALNSTWDGVKT